MRKSRFSEEQSLGILRLAVARQTVAEVCQQQGISEEASSHWKAQYGNWRLVGCDNCGSWKKRIAR